jgi:hypothetical protein
MSKYTTIQHETLSDGSKVYNVAVCSDADYPEESTATFHCINSEAAMLFAEGVDDLIASYVIGRAGKR